MPIIEGSHIQHGYRPVVIVSNNLANKFSPVITVVPLTSKCHKHPLITHVMLNCECLRTTSVALCEQVMSIDKARLVRFIGEIASETDRTAIQHSLISQLDLVA